MSCYVCRREVREGEDYFTDLQGERAHWHCQPAYEVAWQARPEYRAAFLAGWKLARATFERRPRPIRARRANMEQLELAPVGDRILARPQRIAALTDFPYPGLGIFLGAIRVFGAHD